MAGATDSFRDRSADSASVAVARCGYQDLMTSAMSRGLRFGVAAETYERFRIGYPDEVVDRTLAYAGRPVADAVEVGAGTGKATRAFASRGVQVTALEPDPDMYAVLLRETTGMAVEPVLSDLESYDGPRVDLLYAAASWHWTDPASRLDHAARLLRPGGVLAVFGSPMNVADPEVQAAVDAVTGGTLDDPVVRPTDDELRAGTGFTDVRHHVVQRRLVLPQREYVGYLSTLSAYLELPLETRQEVLRRIADVVPPQLPVDLAVGLHLARRA
jgi:trans-aconitate methyltransferase